MVARINTNKSLSRTLNYNEQKVKAGTAAPLFTSGFIKGVEKLSYYDKIRQFERYMSLNERSTNKTLHISLNFDNKDQLNPEKLNRIAEDYMHQIGFGHQPYLVYQHFDAGHPHIHIVTTNIQKDGSRIATHNIGRNQSEKARKELEHKYKLIPAAKGKKADLNETLPIPAQKITIGKMAVKQAISNVLKEVIDNYRFSSLPEFNAVLSLYHVNAFRGTVNSNSFKHNGLVYRVLDPKGKPIGPPLKASSFYFKPTMAFLNKKFKENEPLKRSAAQRFMVEIQFALAKAYPPSMEHFMKELEAARFSIILRQNKDGPIYGITYIDHKTKTVFNGSDLGKEYSAKAILERFNPAADLTTSHPVNQLAPVNKKIMEGTIDVKGTLVEILLTPEQEYMPVPYPLKRESKKKKRKSVRL